MFAEHLIFFLKIQDHSNCFKLRKGLDHLGQWCVRNGMELHIDKCHPIIFSRSRNPIQYAYNLSGRPLGVVSQIKDLGVILDKKLFYGPHITLAISKSLHILVFIRRCTKNFLNTSSIKLVYCAVLCALTWSIVLVCGHHITTSTTRL